MKTVILCGGKGTRMREETEFRPKPLVQIGDKPIIWHIMKIYSFFGYNDFLLCVGYKGELIKRYFMDMSWLNNDFTISLGDHANIKIHSSNNDNWTVTLVDTGLEAQTGSRIKQVEKYIDTDNFMLTYGDGLSDVNINALVEKHRHSGRIATLTGVHPTSPFGVFQTQNDIVTAFKEKPVLDDTINGGFMVLNKRVFDYIPDTDCAFEQEPLHRLAQDGEIGIYPHNGFWTAIDTHKDIERVNAIWTTGEAPWKLWN
jgi:glucose-1-phosphate cytidylyltransferase